MAAFKPKFATPYGPGAAKSPVRGEGVVKSSLGEKSNVAAVSDASSCLEPQWPIETLNAVDFVLAVPKKMVSGWEALLAAADQGAHEEALEKVAVSVKLVMSAFVGDMTLAKTFSYTELSSFVEIQEAVEVMSAYSKIIVTKVPAHELITLEPELKKQYREFADYYGLTNKELQAFVRANDRGATSEQLADALEAAPVPHSRRSTEQRAKDEAALVAALDALAPVPKAPIEDLTFTATGDLVVADTLKTKVIEELYHKLTAVDAAKNMAAFLKYAF